MADMTCLAEGLVVPADFETTGINLNEIVIGPTGCGKSYSNAYPRLCHSFDTSIVVPLSKKDIKDKFAKMFNERGYNVIVLDFAHPESCDYGYDPMNFIHTDEDVVQTAKTLIGNAEEKNPNIDPYWNSCATSILAAEISLVRLNAMEIGKKASFADVIKLHRSLRTNLGGALLETNLDFLFERAATHFPGNQASELWKTMQNLAPRTASCILSVLNSAIDKIMTPSVIQIMEKENKIDFRKIGSEKTAFFIITSPMNKSLQSFINLMYADMFRELFECAEEKSTGRLDVPVHFVCDDFACGGRIHNFEEYISIFRAAGISVTLLLQSETQLISMYGDEAAVSIINNCDTYVYMGGTDIKTCQNISYRLNMPTHKVMSLPLEQVAVFRRGSKPYIGRRYQILDDPIYKEL